jgi:hypothetical protein
VGGFVLVQHGLSGGGILFLAAFCVLSTALIGLKFGLFTIAISLLAIVSVGIAMVTQGLPFDPDMIWNSTSIYSWSVAGALHGLDFRNLAEQADGSLV